MAISDEWQQELRQFEQLAAQWSTRRFSTATVKRFRTLVHSFYRQHGRDAPWRRNRTPYRVLVSEIMLQQTQVPRVVEPYGRFLKLFPTFQALAAAAPHEVIRAWQGLGYNRRGLALKKTAEQVVAHFNGRLPRDTESLTALPGIGTYTAAAVRVFAFEIPDVVIETNIRTVYYHFFFHGWQTVSEADLEDRIRQSLDVEQPREWYYGLMDLGSALKRSGVKLNRLSPSYRTQSTFSGSRREVRGKVLRAVSVKDRVSRQALERCVGGDARLGEVLEQLCAEGLLEATGRSFKLPS
ncbi:MAG: hypothetical protein KDD69_10700 [Bdellovibrionales bacterium]|nr:hypothetical protein [Bdellovibrionales bacterium]